MAKGAATVNSSQHSHVCYIGCVAPCKIHFFSGNCKKKTLESGNTQLKAQFFQTGLPVWLPVASSCSPVDTAATFPQTLASNQEQSTHPHTHTSINHEVHNALKIDLDEAELLNLFRLATLVQSKQSRPFHGRFPAPPACRRHKMVTFCCVTGAATRSSVGPLTDEPESHSALLPT